MSFLQDVPNPGNTITTLPAGALIVLLSGNDHTFITPSDFLAGFSGTTVAPVVLTFAGIIGALSGNQIISPTFGDTSTAARDGLGNLTLPTAANVQGLFKGLGLQDDHTFTIKYKTGGAVKTFMFCFRGTGVPGSTYSGYAIHVNDVGKVVELFAYSKGSLVGQVGTSQAYATSPVNTVDVVVVGTAFTVRFDGTQVAAFSDGTVTGTGYIGVGTSLIVVAAPCSLKEIDIA